jgi:hypothetical protein
MPKSESRTKYSTHESSTKPTENPNEVTETVPKPASIAQWSKWIWGDEIKLYYRGRLSTEGLLSLLLLEIKC